MLNLLIDINENTNKNLVVALEKKGLLLIPEDLGVGDFFIAPNYVIERKAYSDFISSSKGHGGLRVFAQLKKMKDKQKKGYKSILILEGDEGAAIFNKSRNSGRSFGAVLNQVSGLKLAVADDFGIPVITSASMDDTAYILKRIIEKATKSDEEDKPVPTRSSVPASKPLPEKGSYLLESFPFIGPKTVRNITKTYNNIWRFFKDCITNPDRVATKVPRLNKKVPHEVRAILLYGGE